MDKNLIPVLVLGGYFLIPIFATALILIWNIKQAGERPPLDFILRRGPGESLRRKLAEGDENFPLMLLVLPVAPWVVACLLAWAALKLGKEYVLSGLILAGTVLLAGLVISSWWTYRYALNRRNYLLGYLGERAVAEELETLLQKGYRVFHDVPAEGQSKFNLDHVVVGPTGLFAIETKTRRKGRVRAGFAEHKVFYDGRQLIWPWAEDTYCLKQVINEADWLTQWIERKTGYGITAKPILALPGWWVETSALGPVSVQNHKNVPKSIVGKGARVLDDKQIDLIARQLDERCRDVKN